MIAKIEGKNVSVYKSTGAVLRRFSCPTQVQGAQVNGDELNVQLADGHCIIYNLDGRIIRRI